jgi:Protein of unknown function (DUF2961)
MLGGAAQAQNPGSGTSGRQPALVPAYARAQSYKSLKQSSYDTTGGNRDSWRIEPGQARDVFHAEGSGIITHIWFTISAQSVMHLKELVLRIYWEGNSKPSVETPVGDFFGLNLGDYFLHESAFLNCSSVKALNSYFAMPFRRAARISVTNEGQKPVGSFYSNIDYQLVQELPADALYFHAQYRQSTPNRATSAEAGKPEINLEGQSNYIFFETKGRGQMLGVTLGVVQNKDAWFGEGDEMLFVDGDAKPVITGTGTEDYFCGAWDFGGRDGAIPFSHRFNGAPYIGLAERAGGRYCLYRWHADNPVTFERSFKHTIEHGHANDRADCYYSVGYWYQNEPYTDFPSLPVLETRIPSLKVS